MIWLLLAALAAVLAFPYIIEVRKTPMGRGPRIGAPGAFAKLSQGVTYYRWFGPSRGPVAIAIHGTATPSQVWEGVANGLGKLGYRVLTYDLYGRGLSDRAKGAQTHDFFQRQLTDLLQELEIEDEITLIGFSMGGSIAAEFAAAAPHRVKQMILIAPTGIVMNEGRFMRFCRLVPVLGDWLFFTLGPRRMRAEIDNWQFTGGGQDLADLQMAEMSRQGYLPSLLRSQRGVLSEKQEVSHRKVHKSGLPVLAIWGQRDQLVPISALGQLTQWNRTAKQEMVKDAGHALLTTHDQEISSLLRDVLREPR